MLTLARFVQTSPLMVVAHRGASGSAPENTLAAIGIALEDGANMIEVDVQFSADREAVVIHDEDLERTTDGKGLVRHSTYAYIRSLDAGTWFHSQHKQERVPLLIEVLEHIRGRAYLNLELKPLNGTQSLEDIGALVDILRKRDWPAYMVMSSFDHRAIAFVKSIAPEFHTCAISIPGGNSIPSELVRTCKADAFGCSLAELNSIVMSDAHEKNIPVGVYTVNTRSALKRCLQYGVKAVATNYPARIKTFFEETFKSGDWDA